MLTRWGLIAVSVFALAACDAVRLPGDGREPPPDVPEGAPGPPPPTTPVDNPWGEDEDPVDTPTPNDTPDTPPATDTGDTNPPVDPVDPTETDPDVVTPDDDPAATDDPVDEPPTDTTPDPNDNGTDEDPAEPPVVSPPPPPPPVPVAFEYHAPGDLIPGTGSGLVDDTVYAPEMVFPIKAAPTFPQSMVYRLGGAVGGDQCDPANYQAPWRDNFCEKRSTTRNTPMCPTNKVHQGQDIRTGTAADCETLRRTPKAERGLHEVVAVEDGIIQHIGTYSVQLKGTQTGNIYSYLHLNMARLQVSAMDIVSAGDTIGFVSNDFGSTPTTFHLHFEVKAPIEGEGIIHVPPYMSLVAAYERREAGRGELVEDETVAIASFPVIPDDIEIIE